MNYEQFRNDFASHLTGIPADQLHLIMTALDATAMAYDISKLCTDLTIYSNNVPEAVRTYIASKAIQKLSSATLKQYMNVISNFFISVRIPITDVTTNTIRVYLYNYQAEHGVSDSSLDGIRRILSGFFAWCVDDGLLAINPCKRVGAIKYQEAVREPLDAVQLEIIRRSCTDPRDKFVIDFLYSTACRVSEFCNIMKSDVDLTAGTVRILHGKGNKYRVTYLNAEAIVSLKAYLATRKDTSPYLIVSQRKPAHQLTRSAVERILKLIEKRSGVNVHLFPHLFRHTSATCALAHGMAIEQVRQFLGHSKIDTTLRYAKVLDSDVQASHRKALS